MGIRRLQPAVGVLILSGLALCACCRPADQPKQSSTASGSDGVSTSGQFHDELLGIAVDNLNRLEEFDPPDVLDQMARRLAPPGQGDSAEGQPADTLLSAWPETEMLRQIVDRLNQWIRTQPASDPWRVEPMVASLPKPLTGLPLVKQLDRMEFSRFDGYALHEAVLVRDLGRWTTARAVDDLDRAKTLFDWTVRNIQLEADSDKRIPLLPWETLLFGRGTATERAWVFILAARQLGLDAAMLGLASEKAEKSNSTSSGGPRPWCIGVLIGGKVYLFDPTLGLPIPAPGSIDRSKSGQLTIQPATLAQVAGDEKLLRQLDADKTHPYPVKTSDLKRVVVMLEASPTYLARRMKLLESRLAGARRIVLSTAPTAQAEHWKAAGNVERVELWRQPFETLDRRSRLTANDVRVRLVSMVPFYVMPSAPLHRGRLLHLKGKLAGDDGATYYYQKARPSNEEVLASSAHQVEKGLFLSGKHDASYWLGLVAYERRNFPAAVDWFKTRTLEATANSPWADGARYNLGRTCESGGNVQLALTFYARNPTSPAYRGELLRATWLGGQGRK